MVVQRSDMLVLLATLTATLAIVGLRRKKKSQPLPPGPRGLPVLGNLLDLPKGFEWETYARWSKELNSDIIHLAVAGSDIIILNSLKATNDLLDKRSTIYSSRPQLVMLTELSGWGWVMSMMPYGEAWKKRRTLFTKYFHPNNDAAYRPMLAGFVHRMLLQLLESPEDFLTITQQAMGGWALSLGYGLEIQPKNDPYVAAADEAIHEAAKAAVPGTYLVEIMPWLKHIPMWFPGAGFQRKAKDLQKLSDQFKYVQFDAAVQNIVAGTAKPSFMSAALENNAHASNDAAREAEIRDTAGMVFVAGADTTVAATQTMFLAMVNYPEAQKKAQSALDSVLHGRMPTLDDEKDLPYISAIVKEVLRWQPVTPIAIPHFAGEDDVYAGYRIPKGSTVVGNTWAILHDKEVYPNPSTFIPERFLTIDGKLDTTVQDPSVAAFGFGRRLCPGRHIAISAVWLMTATILSSFEITKATDENDEPIAAPTKYRSGLICHPEPFRCSIKPRSAKAEAQIRAAADIF